MMQVSPSLKRLLIINPNTSTSVTNKLVAYAQAQLPSSITIDAVTASFGAPYIVDEPTFAIAQEATIEAWTRALESNQPTSILIACFGDPGLLMLRQRSRVPVTGLAQASFQVAAKHGRFAIVTGGAPWKPILQDLALRLGWQQQLAGIETVALNGAQLAADPAGARELLSAACQHAADIYQADTVILGGAGLAGVAAQIQTLVSVPLIDSVSAGIQVATQSK